MRTNVLHKQFNPFLTGLTSNYNKNKSNPQKIIFM